MSNKVFLFLFTVLSTCSQADQHSLAHIMRDAREHDAGYLSSKATFQSKKISAQKDMRAMLPTVDLSSKLINKYGDTQTNLESKFSVSVPVYNPKSQLKAKSGHLSMENILLSERAFEQNYTLDVARAYFDLLSKHALLNAANIEEAQYQKNYEQVVEMYENGLKSNIDVLSAQTNLNLSTVSNLEAKSAFNHARSTLEKMINQPITELQSTDTQNEIQLPLLEQSDIVDLAQSNNLALKISQNNLRQAQNTYNQSTTDFLPSLNLITEAKFADGKFWDEDAYTSNVYLNFSVNLFNKGNDQLSLKSSGKAHEAASLSLKNNAYDLTLNTQKAHADIASAQARLQATQTANETAKLRLEATYEQHKMGEESELDLFHAINQASLARRNYINAQHTLVIKHLEMLQILGELSEPSIDEISHQLTKTVYLDANGHPSSASDLAANFLPPYAQDSAD